MEIINYIFAGLISAVCLLFIAVMIILLIKMLKDE
nr:MAG TPA: hypothetical protein [Crassvirales sp.]